MTIHAQKKPLAHIELMNNQEEVDRHKKKIIAVTEWIANVIFLYLVFGRVFFYWGQCDYEKKTVFSVLCSI